MALGYSWTNIASWSVSKGQATVTFYIDAKLNRQDTAGNYSVVDTRLNSTIVNSLSGSGYNFQLTGSGGISGSSVWYFGNETILTGQYTVSHNSNGKASSTVSAYAYNKYWGIDQWFSGSFDLPTIARNFTSTPKISTASTTTTSATFNWSTSETCNWVRYHLDGSSSWTDVFSGSTKSGSFTINNLTSNSSHKVYVECRRADSGLWSNSNTVNFTTSSKTGHLKINGENKDATPYIRVNNEWKKAVPYIRNNGEWKRGK